MNSQDENSVDQTDSVSDSPIDSFRGEFAFLSNFFPTPIFIDGQSYPTAEHAFQALKTDDSDERKKVLDAPTPTAAKSRGKKVTLRANWNQERFAMMDRVLRIKFSDPDLAQKLIATGERELIEGNTWRDTTWGCTKGKDGLWKGLNELGKLLMKIRTELSDCSHQSFLMSLILLFLVKWSLLSATASVLPDRPVELVGRQLQIGSRF